VGLTLFSGGECTGLGDVVTAEGTIQIDGTMIAQRVTQ
jgi:hypothetical protein